MRESLIRTGVFVSVIAVALGAVLLGNEPKPMNGAETVAEDIAEGVASSERETITPDVRGFTAVEISVPAKIAFTVGKDYAVTITGDKATLARIETRVRDGTLEIRRKDQRRFRGHHNLTITLSAPELSAVAINGAAEGRIAGMAGGRFALTVNGAGHLDVLGKCDAFVLTINGAGDVSAENFLCRAVTATINGAGDADVHASASLTATINGAGNITVYGHPKTVHSSKIGFGRINILSDAKTGE